MDTEKKVVSIVGAGGKTTLMFTLAEKLRKENKVLVTTTTKIFVPESFRYDYIAFDNTKINELSKSLNKGIYVYGSSVTTENKLTGLEPKILESLIKYFDYILIESDGAKRKLVKGWNSAEPVIIESTTHTLGVLNIKALGLEINSENIHRMEEFIKITGSCIGDKININHLTQLALNKNGLFKNSKGKKVLYVFGENNELINSLKDKSHDYIDEIRCIKC